MPTPWLNSTALWLCLLACAAARAELAVVAPEQDAPARESCWLKRDGAACTEADPIFQEAMEQLNRERAQQAREPGDSLRKPDAAPSSPITSHAIDGNG